MTSEVGKDSRLVAQVILQHITSIIFNFQDLTSHGVKFVIVPESQMAVVVSTALARDISILASTSNTEYWNHLNSQLPAVRAASGAPASLTNMSRNIMKHIYLYHDFSREIERLVPDKGENMSVELASQFETRALIRNDGAFNTESIGFYTNSAVKNHGMERLNMMLMTSKINFHPRFFTLNSTRTADQIIEQIGLQMQTLQKEPQLGAAGQRLGFFKYGKAVSPTQKDDFPTAIALCSMAHYYWYIVKLLQIV